MIKTNYAVQNSQWNGSYKWKYTFTAEPRKRMADGNLFDSSIFVSILCNKIINEREKKCHALAYLGRIWISKLSITYLYRHFSFNGMVYCFVFLCIFIFRILIHNFIALAWDKKHREYTRLTRIHNIILRLSKKIKIAFYQTESSFLFLYTVYCTFITLVIHSFNFFIRLYFKDSFLCK